jgi:Fe2+ or Zn2+ uptake regulation protein
MAVLIRQAIIELLRESDKPLSAKEIAKNVKSDSKTINHELYSGYHFVKDESETPKWSYYATNKFIFVIPGCTIIMSDITKLETFLNAIDGEKKLSYVKSNLSNEAIKIAEKCGFTCTETK